MMELEVAGQGLVAGGKLLGLYIPPTSSLWLWAALGRALSLGKEACPQLRRPPRELTAEATRTSASRVLGRELRVHLSDNREPVLLFNGRDTTCPQQHIQPAAENHNSLLLQRRSSKLCCEASAS